MAKPYLSVIIPAYNEAERLPLTLVDIDKYLSKADYTYEILVINDASEDNTAEIVCNMEKMVKHLKLIDNNEHQGRGGVVRQGMLLAKGKVRLFVDADYSISIDQVANVFSHIREGFDVVIGSRAVKGSRAEKRGSLNRRIQSAFMNLVIQLLLLRGVWDTQCGFKAFTEEAAEKLFSQCRIAGWIFDVEVIALAKRLGYRVKEIPVVWSHVPRVGALSTSKLQILWDVLKIRWWLWMGKYQITH